MEEVKTFAVSALEEIHKARDIQTLESVRIAYLGKKGLLTQKLKSLSALPAEQRRESGQLVNDTKQQLITAIEKRKQELVHIALEERLAHEKIDISLPARGEQTGTLHPISLCFKKIEQFFTRIGFSIVEGPDIEDDFHNFEALNIPPQHPARAMHDTFYLKNGSLLRTHTSPVQIRTMQQYHPPLKIIAPGRVYRRDSDMTHSPMFHQVEGLVVEQSTSFVALKGVVQAFLRNFFDNNLLEIRFRPSYFPFTEPSAEVDIRDQSGNWLEVMGCGMVHPNVFDAVDYDNDKWNGYAFGLGVERLAMLLYGVDDLRLFFENDIRFINQFATYNV